MADEKDQGNLLHTKLLPENNGHSNSEVGTRFTEENPKFDDNVWYDTFQHFLNPSFKTAVMLLTCVCGVMDAVAFIGLGGIYTNIQTGNIIQLACFAGYLTSGRIPDSKETVAALALSLLSFIVGAVLGGYCMFGPPGKFSCRFFKEKRVGFLLEWMFLLVAFIFACIYNASDPEIYGDILHPTMTAELWLVIIFSASAMGIQTALLRSFSLLDFASNLMTLAMVGLFSEWKLVGGSNPRWHRRAGSIFLFVVSVLVGAAISLKGKGPMYPLLLDLLLLTYCLRALLLGSPPPTPPPANAPSAPPPSLPTAMPLSLQDNASTKYVALKA